MQGTKPQKKKSVARYVLIGLNIKFVLYKFVKYNFSNNSKIETIEETNKFIHRERSM